jgi:excisionase family DNA binding protein
MHDRNGASPELLGAGLVRVGEAARFLAVSTRHLQNLTKDGMVPHVRFGKRGVRYTRQDLVEFVQRHRMVGEGGE